MSRCFIKALRGIFNFMRNTLMAFHYFFTIGKILSVPCPEPGDKNFHPITIHLFEYPADTYSDLGFGLNPSSSHL
jgi:hypothetical protein